jgi:hypothetical protein
MAMLSNGDVISDLWRFQAPEIAQLLLRAGSTSSITHKCIEVDMPCQQITNRKPMSKYQPVTSLPACETPWRRNILLVTWERSETLQNGQQRACLENWGQCTCRPTDQRLDSLENRATSISFRSASAMIAICQQVSMAKQFRNVLHEGLKSKSRESSLCAQPHYIICATISWFVVQINLVQDFNTKFKLVA